MNGKSGADWLRPRLRYLVGLLALATLAVVVLAPSAPAGPFAEAGEKWEGTWRFSNEFGSGRMELCQDKPNGSIRGFYRGDTDRGRGRIHGDLTQRGTVWGAGFSGVFTTPEGDTGYFYANYADEHFSGEFRSCRRFCERYGWSGDRVDRRPADNLNCG